MLLDVVLSGERPLWPDGKRLNVISSGERRVLPDGALTAKDTLRMGPSISDEMVPSIVAEDGIALRVYCRLAEGQRHCFATRKTPLNSSRVLQCSGKGAT